MSEFDSLSDSDWLDVSSSGRDSDNDSIVSQDSDRDDIGSMPQSRRSSFSNEGSMSGEAAGWEGIVSDSGDEVSSGMYPLPLTLALEPQPIQAGLTPAVDPGAPLVVLKDDEEKRVIEALDQSFIGTLNASRSSTVPYPSSTHASIRDLRLSFPDPLTSSRDELNRSYEAISSTETYISSGSEDDVNPPTHTIIPPVLQDPGAQSTTPAVPHHEVSLPEPLGNAELEIVLYGSPSTIKWTFVQELIRKAAIVSGHVFVNTLQDGEGEKLIQSIRLDKQSSEALPFYDMITSAEDRCRGLFLVNHVSSSFDLSQYRRPTHGQRR